MVCAPVVIAGGAPVLHPVRAALAAISMVATDTRNEPRCVLCLASLAARNTEHLAVGSSTPMTEIARSGALVAVLASRVLELLAVRGKVSTTYGLIRSSELPGAPPKVSTWRALG